MVIPRGFLGPGSVGSWVALAADALVARGPVLFWGLILTSSVDSGVTVRHGVNTAAPRVIEVRLVTATEPTVALMLPVPILLDNGLFIDLFAGGGDVFVLFEPIREEQMIGRLEQPVEGAPE